MKRFLLLSAILMFAGLALTLHAEEKTVRILAIGDSTTAGTPFFRSPVEAPPDGAGDPEAPYTYWLTKGHEDWMVFNRGVAGERTDEVFERMKKDIPLLKPDIAIVLAGVNDLYQGHSSIRVQNRLEEIYQFAADSRLPVIACTVLPYNQASDDIREKIAAVNRWIADYSQKNGLFFCDTAALVEAPGKPGYLMGSPDGLHPDKENYRKMGESLRNTLEQSLKSMKNKGL